jgi:hypothetical protein
MPPKFRIQEIGSGALIVIDCYTGKYVFKARSLHEAEYWINEQENSFFDWDNTITTKKEKKKEFLDENGNPYSEENPCLVEKKDTIDF